MGMPANWSLGSPPQAKVPEWRTKAALGLPVWRPDAFQAIWTPLP
jgi:hypothetical protein